MKPIKIKVGFGVKAYDDSGKVITSIEVEKDDILQDSGVSSIIQNIKLPTCPECESTDLVQAGKCTTCYACGWSMCSL